MPVQLVSPTSSIVTEPESPTPSIPSMPFHNSPMTRSNELQDSMRSAQDNSGQRDPDPSPVQVQDSTLTPENEVSAILKNSPQLSHDHYHPIFIMKGTRECTKLPLFPLSKLCHLKNSHHHIGAF